MDKSPPRILRRSCLSVCLCVCVCLCMWLSVCMPVFVCGYLSACLCAWLSVCICVWLSVRACGCLSIFASIYLPVLISRYLSIYLTDHISVRPSLILSRVYLPVYRRGWRGVPKPNGLMDDCSMAGGWSWWLLTSDFAPYGPKHDTVMLHWCYSLRCDSVWYRGRVWRLSSREYRKFRGGLIKKISI